MQCASVQTSRARVLQDSDVLVCYILGCARVLHPVHTSTSESHEHIEHASFGTHARACRWRPAAGGRACVCVCVCARARVCVRVCVCVCVPDALLDKGGAVVDGVVEPHVGLELKHLPRPPMSVIKYYFILFYFKKNCLVTIPVI